ncbi:hypothetical protein RE628_16565 [Paenibacillus sp. D2_2]|uniref:DUF6886 family protein n=1 Tax=Paenibacillus sp. D2_2 TaxID=3073092 RepID=UPI00281677D9|nr:DUF6886 family protein [Paenibacillus sp. D2_2]WMT39115.1 hypothetical protein RE628_16565 [Paenibacillus sp. D2_2]
MLYHISEESNIEVFVPRKAEAWPDLPPVVWAMNDKHLINYLFPRECPRIIFSNSPEVCEADRERFFLQTAANTIIAVESGWLERIKQAQIYKYYFADDSFELMDEIAGYYVSTETVRPLRIEPIKNLISQLLSYDIELRFTPNLHPLKNAILSSTITDYSMIRMRNACPDTNKGD